MFKNSNECREVRWYRGVRGITRTLLGKKAIVCMDIDEVNFRPMPSPIKAADIGQLRDPQLRYALRFADAVEALSYFRNLHYPDDGLHVVVYGTDEGISSRLIDVTYPDVGRSKDAFTRFLEQARPAKYR